MTRKAFDRKLDRDVAVKSLTPGADPEVAAAARSRFLREARALARFDHPGIVRVYEVFEEDGCGPPRDGAPARVGPSAPS